MPLQPVLIAGEWRENRSSNNTFTTINPSTKSPLPDHYPVSNEADVELALDAAQQAKVELRSSKPEALAHFLERFADAIEARRKELVNVCYQETALPKEPRLNSVELPRTTHQLRQAAAAVRDRSWRHATIDTQTNIRSIYSPLDGPVVVFGPNNFPFAFNSVAGGDFAAAIAAGNPVIAKANTAHPGTSKLLAELAFETVQVAGLPRAMVQLIYRTSPETGFKLVSHPLVGATGFTGSKNAGLRLKEAADKAGKPIYLEMSSINPIFILPGALEERLSEIALEFFNSCTLGAGQFCTNPGFVVLLQNGQSEAFLLEAKARFESAPPGILLGPNGPRDISAAIQTMQQHGAQIVTGGYEVPDTGFSFANTLLRVSGETFLQNAGPLQTEAFGAVSLLVFVQDVAQMLAVTAQLEGNLTGTIYSHSQGQDDDLYQQLEPVLRPKVGRLLNDKMPTGVAVSPAMNHGGPYPATGHPGFTAVGIPAAMLRFAALQCYDNVRSHRLPSELRDQNPTGRTWRFIDGEWTQRSL